MIRQFIKDGAALAALVAFTWGLLAWADLLTTIKG